MPCEYGREVAVVGASEMEEEEQKMTDSRKRDQNGTETAPPELPLGHPALRAAAAADMTASIMTAPTMVKRVKG